MNIDSLKKAWKDNSALGTVLVLIIGLLVGVYQPFLNREEGAERTVTVEGVATVTASPDEYNFYPNFTAEADTQAEAIEKATKRSDKAVDELRKLGVDDSKIDVDISSYEDYDWRSNDDEPTGYVAYVNLQVTSSDKEQADSIQTYFISSGAEGTVTPAADFSEESLAQLKADARAKAVENAKANANQIATELDAKLGKVQSIEEVSGFDYPIFYGGIDAVAEDAAVSRSSSSDEVFVGEQDITFTVNAVFAIK